MRASPMRTLLLLPLTIAAGCVSDAPGGSEGSPDLPCVCLPDLWREPIDMARPVEDMAPAPPAPIELWFYLQTNLQVNGNVTAANALLDRAAAAGYTGMVLADYKLGILQTGIPAAWYVPNVKMVLDHAATKGVKVVPAIFDIGYSDTLLAVDPNWGEGMAVKGAPFVVSNDGQTLGFLPSPSPLTDGGFEQHSGNTFTGWDWQDARAAADTKVFHGGGVSVRIDAGAGNARVVKAIGVTPHRQYHVRGWLKTDQLAGGYVNAMLLDVKSGRARNQWNGVPHQATQGFTAFDFVANSGDSTSLSLYVGVWGDSKGTAWFDDLSVEEVALINVIRRPGAPLAVSDGGGKAYVEGADFAPIADPLYKKGVEVTDWHAAPTVTVPKGSRLAPGTKVTIDYYAVQPVNGAQIAACLTEPAVMAELGKNFDAVSAVFGPKSGWFLEYDEMRQGNTCGACAARGVTAGKLLADHVAMTTSLIRGKQPGAALYTWSDMFDPHHNAVDNYYLVEGTLAESWKGLPADLVVMNWNLGTEHAPSLKFFSDLGHPQIIAGYYDSGDGAASAKRELVGVRNTPGLRGLMYTTWEADFSQLESYATAAKAAW